MLKFLSIFSDIVSLQQKITPVVVATNPALGGYATLFLVGEELLGGLLADIAAHNAAHAAKTAASAVQPKA